MGDLPGLRSRLGYLADLGVDAIWLAPFYPSPLFGGSAWTRVTEGDGRPGQWYLHLYDTSQPDWKLAGQGRSRAVRGRDQVLARWLSA